MISKRMVVIAFFWPFAFGCSAYLIYSMMTYTRSPLWSGIAVFVGLLFGVGLCVAHHRSGWHSSDLASPAAEAYNDDETGGDLFWVGVITATLTLLARLFLSQAQINYINEGIAAMLAIFAGYGALRATFKR